VPEVIPNSVLDYDLVIERGQALITLLYKEV